MNRKEIKTFDQLKNEVLDIKEDVTIIKTCLLGNPKRPLEEPGLVGVIGNNKRWRRSVNKTLTFLIPVSVGLAVRAIWTWILGDK
jgi:hypothetical protein